jgi:hypothetical protein
LRGLYGGEQLTRGRADVFPKRESYEIGQLVAPSAGFNREIVVYVLAHFPSDVFEELEIDAWKLLLKKPFVPF